MFYYFRETYYYLYNLDFRLMDKVVNEFLISLIMDHRIFQEAQLFNLFDRDLFN